MRDNRTDQMDDSGHFLNLSTPTRSPARGREKPIWRPGPCRSATKAQGRVQGTRSDEHFFTSHTHVEGGGGAYGLERTEGRRGMRSCPCTTNAPGATSARARKGRIGKTSEMGCESCIVHQKPQTRLRERVVPIYLLASRRRGPCSGRWVSLRGSRARL